MHVIQSDNEAVEIATAFAAQLAQGASERDRTVRLPIAEVVQLKETGLLGITVPREFGGAEVRYQTVARVFQTIARADPCVAQLPQSHFVFTEAICLEGSQEQKRFFFEELLAGKLIGNALAERNDTLKELKTRLIPSGESRFRLSGNKVYCTGALVADWIAVSAVADRDRLVLAYVPRHAAGVSVAQDWNAMGQRTTFSGSARFEEVEVLPEWVIEHGRVLARPTLFHAFSQMIHVAIDVGIAITALEDTATAIRSRKRARAGAPDTLPTEDPLLVHRLGQLCAKSHAAEELLHRSARFLDEAKGSLTEQSVAHAGAAVAEAKAFAEDVVIEITNELFALAGTSATDNDLNLHRHWRNARTHTVHDANAWRYHAAGDYFLNGASPKGG